MLIIAVYEQGVQCSSYEMCLNFLQVNSLQKVIKLTKENLDKIEGQFLNVQHPPSIFFEVGTSGDLQMIFSLSVIRNYYCKCCYGSLFESFRSSAS